jgi:hypothetical protein
MGGVPCCTRAHLKAGSVLFQASKEKKTLIVLFYCDGWLDGRLTFEIIGIDDLLDDQGS